MIEALPQSTLADGVRVVTHSCASSRGRVIDATYPATRDFDTHEHGEAYLCLPVAGAFDEWWGGRRRSVSGVRALVYGLGSRHAVRTGPHGLRLLHVTDPRGGAWEDSPDRRAVGLLWQIAALLDDARAHGPTDDDRLHLDALVLELAGGPEPEGASDWLQSVVERLREAHGSAPSLSELAAEVDRHPAHLVRAFRARFGMTPGAFLRRVRVAAAVTRLRDTEEPLSFVAAASGFADQSHMGRWIRRYVRRTPLEIRRGAGDP